MDSTEATDLPAPGRSATRARRLVAVLVDASTGLLFVVGATMGAFAWLLLVSDLGSREPGSLASSVAFSLLLATVPAWYGTLAASSWAGTARGATLGQARAGCTTEGPRGRRLLRLAVHPLGSIGWWWLAGVSALATVPVVPLLLTAVGILVLAGGAISATLALVRPSVPSLHDRIAGTRTVPA
ncbi:MAG: hypothetical protein O2888_03245 [Chloroflexi bacterium]|nr:hypothetical protein [Chloroflexota bacterium]